jgi:hypothetical protein
VAKVYLKPEQCNLGASENSHRTVRRLVHAASAMLAIMSPSQSPSAAMTTFLKQVL